MSIKTTTRYYVSRETGRLEKVMINEKELSDFYDAKQAGCDKYGCD